MVSIHLMFKLILEVLEGVSIDAKERVAEVLLPLGLLSEGLVVVVQVLLLCG